MKPIILSKRSARKLNQRVGISASQPILNPTIIPKQNVRNSLSILSKIYMGHCEEEVDVKRTISNLKSKIRGYATQDVAMGRDPIHNVNVEETTHKLIASGLKCCYCERIMWICEESDFESKWH